MCQKQKTTSISIIVLTVGVFPLLILAQDRAVNREDAMLHSAAEFDRSSQDLGLGKRVYGYLSEYKRLPVYNFGLGKRTYPYSFGLGKRSRMEEEGDNSEEYDEYPNNEDLDQIPELELYHDDAMQGIEKRQKLYSFGLGKRLHRYDFGLGKRGQIYKYDFGLGKRAFQPSGGRDNLYNFGLGKRTRMYSFGLGKRPYNQGPMPSRFNFGLGKRSEDSDISKSVISKREVREESLPTENNNKSDLALTSTNTSGNSNQTSELESHEIMGHSDKFQMSKRNPYKYVFENGKTPAFRANGGFSRQFRKPLYNFGLGKRTSSLNKNTEQDFKPISN